MIELQLQRFQESLDRYKQCEPSQWHIDNLEETREHLGELLGNEGPHLL